MMKHMTYCEDPSATAVECGKHIIPSQMVNHCVPIKANDHPLEGRNPQQPFQQAHRQTLQRHGKKRRRIASVRVGVGVLVIGCLCADAEFVVSAGLDPTMTESSCGLISIDEIKRAMFLSSWGEQTATAMRHDTTMCPASTTTTTKIRKQLSSHRQQFAKNDLHFVLPVLRRWLHLPWRLFAQSRSICWRTTTSIELATSPSLRPAPSKSSSSSSLRPAPSKSSSSSCALTICSVSLSPSSSSYLSSSSSYLSGLQVSFADSTFHLPYDPLLSQHQASTRRYPPLDGDCNVADQSYDSLPRRSTIRRWHGQHQRRAVFAPTIMTNDKIRDASRRCLSIRSGATYGSRQEASAMQTKPSKKVKKHLEPPTPPKSKKNSSGVDDPKTLLLIRLLFLTYYGSLGSLMPYLPVYYDSLGHGGQIIGLLGAVKPATTFLIAPVWGLIADKTANPFLILQLTFAVSFIGQLLVGVPHDPFAIMTMVFLTALFNAPVKSLIDTMVLDQIQDRSYYGRLRLWGQMGFGLASSGVGLILSKSQQRHKQKQHLLNQHKLHPSPYAHRSSPLAAPAVPPLLGPSHGALMILDQNSSIVAATSALQQILQWVDSLWQQITGYRLLFFSYAALSVPTWICIQAFQKLDQARQQKEATEAAERKANVAASSEQSTNTAASTSDSGATRKSNKVTEGLSLLLHSGDALLFFLLVLMVGISSGIIENFAYVRMREVGGTGKEMGLSRLVSSMAGAPMFWFSGPLTEALGADRIIVMSLLSYITRFVIYALMRNPYHGLPAEALRGVTFAAFWSTATIYAHRVSPPGLHATMLMILNAMYGGLGQSLGAIIGGRLQHAVGTVRTFLYCAAVDCVLVCLVVLYLTVIKKDSSGFRDPKPIEPKRKGNGQQ